MRADRFAVAAVALLLAAVYLLAPPMGTDLAAQTARADFVDSAGFVPVDLRWYGGTVQYGYSLVAPAVMALIGVRVTGAVALVVSSVAFGLLLVRTGALRPVLGGVLGAVCFAGNLVSGRVTFALGVAFGLCGLLALTASWPAWVRRSAAAVLVVLAGVTSPVAGLFLGLAGVALVLGSSRRWDGGVLALSAAAGLLPTILLSDVDGWMNISLWDTARAVGAAIFVALLVPRRTVRVGAVLAALGVLVAYLVHTPVGLNATRLASMFALPVLAAYVPLPRPSRRSAVAGLVGLALAALWQPPVLHGDVRAAGNPTTSTRYFAPLLVELRARGPVGRVEVVATSDYWESAYVARDVHLARGWLRQADIARNPLFFDGTLSSASYEDWLRDNGVSYVALPGGVRLSWIARREAALVRAGQPYLTEVWRGGDWTLYEVSGRPSIVEGGTLVSTGPASVTVDVPAGETLVRVRYSRWLRADGARLARAPGGWTLLRAPTAGRYTIRS
jgi:hypothetical protein